MEFLFGQETAASGNGGSAVSSASGGAVSLGTIDSGGNMGSAIGVGDTSGGLVCDEWGKCWAGGEGSVDVYGGAMANTTNIGVAADGGTAIADASGGDGNVSFVS